MNIPKDWIEKRAKAEEGDCTTIGAMPELQTTDEWIEACKKSNPDASEYTVREWHRQYQDTGGGFDLPNAQAVPDALTQPTEPSAGICASWH